MPGGGGFSCLIKLYSKVFTSLLVYGRLHKEKKENQTVKNATNSHNDKHSLVSLKIQRANATESLLTIIEK